MNQREVVVKTLLSIEEREDGRVFAARLRELGLTAYGHDTSEAKSNVKRLFNKLINEYRKLGLLEERLNGIGVEWFWRDQYQNLEGEGEETAKPATPPKPAERPGQFRLAETQTMTMAA